MANIQKRVLKGKISWRARYRTPSGAERSKSFDRKVDAERFLTTIESSKIMGWGTPKTYERREVPIPAFLVTELAQQVNRLSDDDLVFAGVRSAGPMRVATFRRGGFNSAAKAIGIPDLHPHELRHTAASLAIAAGADVKVVQQMLGHASAAMTMDIYGHLFDDRLDEVAAAMDDARTASQRPESESPALVLPQQGR